MCPWIVLQKGSQRANKDLLKQDIHRDVMIHPEHKIVFIEH